MDEETLRKMAIEEFLKGKSPASIYRDLGRSSLGSINGFIDTNRGKTTGFRMNLKPPIIPRKPLRISRNW